MLLVIRPLLLDVVNPFSAVGGFFVNTNKFVIPGATTEFRATQGQHMQIG